MTSAVPQAAHDGSSLCRECGSCCDWSMFSFVELQGEEAAWGKSKRLPLLHQGSTVSLRFPCTLLEPHGNARVCKDYEHRPQMCREYECKVLSRYLRGELPYANALALVREARTLIARIEESTTKGQVGLRQEERRDAFLAALEAEGRGSRSIDPDTLLDLGILRYRILTAFHDRTKAAQSTGREAETLVERTLANPG
jgi:Fe-S-cluster containining protein